MARRRFSSSAERFGLTVRNSSMSLAWMARAYSSTVLRTVASSPAALSAAGVGRGAVAREGGTEGTMLAAVAVGAGAAVGGVDGRGRGGRAVAAASRSV